MSNYSYYKASRRTTTSTYSDSLYNVSGVYTYTRRATRSPSRGSEGHSERRESRNRRISRGYTVSDGHDMKRGSEPRAMSTDRRFTTDLAQKGRRRSRQRRNQMTGMPTFLECYAGMGSGEGILDEEDMATHHHYRYDHRASSHHHTISEDDRLGRWSPQSRRSRSRSSSRCDCRALELQLEQAKEALQEMMYHGTMLHDAVHSTADELSRAQEERDAIRNEAQKLREELHDVESRHYKLVEDYEALERDNACLMRNAREVTQVLKRNSCQEDRRALHHIRRRILVEKAVEALKRRYGKRYPMGPTESFLTWSKRVHYLGWERIACMVTDAKIHGNKYAHQATQAQMLQTVIFAVEDDKEAGETGEGEVLRDMYNLVYSEGPGSDIDSE